MVTIGSVKGYYHLDAWIMANIIQLATRQFCTQYYNESNDPCGRMYDQMTQAARSIAANIAEGLSRRQTSRETEMKLTDVARASASELAGDYFFIALSQNIEIWGIDDDDYKALAATRLEKPIYTNDWQHEAASHIIRQKQRFDPWLNNPKLSVRVNALLQLCNREISMLQNLMKSQLHQFEQEGGFTENMTKNRMTALKAAASSAPLCPKCGQPMRKVLAKSGKNAGNEFWGCMDYPTCNGIRNINAPS